MCMRKDYNLPARVDNVAKNDGKKAKNFLCDYSYKTQVGSWPATDMVTNDK